MTIPNTRTISLAVSNDNEGTETPWWLIIDPRQLMRSRSQQALFDVAGMITGPFFSRESAQRHLDFKRHHFSDHAAVFCASGYHSVEYTEAYREGK